MRKHILLLLSSLLLNVAVYSQVKGDEQVMTLVQQNSALQQDSMALQKALSGWWKTSQETLDKRMSWYNDAKFGCFVHWGVYSVAGGNWKGKEVPGYSEHLMRKEQITVDEYNKMLVYPFNPVDFDADEWMRHAANAGMRYFIVTAKHHDGFAMYPSEAYPYDLRLTKFARDPMKELKDAALKYGIKFGFYYSQAYDWEYPDAPGNDWMYDNPGGDKLLHGGHEWWLSYPEFLPRAEKYVREKAIPQICELIENYHPDILWFDMPRKLPLYENIRILESIRKIAPDIVVNGRLAFYDGGNLGDYKNTGDMAAFFYPVEGYWESIPTTNASYGYSHHDNSHKPVCHFVRLLASAASRGGNILMNVGPMGNGKWDERDVVIFDGVGNWLKIYGEAIYGSAKTDLPAQQWGVTTRKGNTLYLHVYHWPKNGKLIVGGLRSDIDKAWIVSDTESKALSVSVSGKNDKLLSLPVAAPDTMNTVIALSLKNEQPAYPVRLLAAHADNTLYAFDATLKGNGFGYGDGKPNRNYVYGWKTDKQYLEWSFRLNEAAEYAIYVDYNTESDNETGEISVTLGKHTFDLKYTPKTEKQGYNSLYAGTVRLGKGELLCTLKGKNRTGNEYMRPIAVRLVKIK